jgi:hypothetical protein
MSEQKKSSEDLMREWILANHSVGLKAQQRPESMYELQNLLRDKYGDPHANVPVASVA